MKQETTDEGRFKAHADWARFSWESARDFTPPDAPSPHFPIATDPGSLAPQ